MSKNVRLLTDFLKMIATARKGGYDNWFPDKVRVVSGGEGSCVCELTIDEDLVNVSNNLHGGCTASIVDMVSTMALMTSPKPFPGVSVELSVSYLSAAKLGDDVVINAQTLKTGRNLAFLVVDIKRKADGAVVAVGKHTKFIGQNVPEKSMLEEYVKNKL